MLVDRTVDYVISNVSVKNYPILMSFQSRDAHTDNQRQDSGSLEPTALLSCELTAPVIPLGIVHESDRAMRPARSVIASNSDAC